MRLGLSALLLWGIGGAASAQTAARPALEHYLRATIGLSPAQMTALAEGSPVSVLLPSANSRDVAVFGAIAVRSTPAAYLALIGDTARFIVLRAARGGVIPDSVTADSLHAIGFDAGEYRQSRNCRPGKCAFKLPADAMQRFAELNWGGPRAREQADSLLRADVLRYVRSYRDSGNAGMVRYADRGPTHAGDVLAELIAQSPGLYDGASALEAHLVAYPARSLSGAPARELLYWSESRIPRMRPTFTLTHATVYAFRSGAPVVARKLLYANHYLEGAVELLAAVPAPPGADGRGLYLLSLRRYRFDNLPGGILNIRGRVRDRLITLVAEELEKERAALER